MPTKYEPEKTMFQFQIGAIKRTPLSLAITVFLLFQFQIGAIKRSDWKRSYNRSFQFQFQIGAIKRETPAEVFA